MVLVVECTVGRSRQVEARKEAYCAQSLSIKPLAWLARSLV